jgi:hypothetical protein
MNLLDKYYTYFYLFNNPGQISTVVNDRILDYQTIWRSLLPVYGTIKYGRKIAPTKGQFTAIYDRECTRKGRRWRHLVTSSPCDPSRITLKRTSWAGVKGNEVTP